MAYSRRNNEGASGRSEESNMVEKVVYINRCAKVVKGGRRFSFSALVVTGDRNGKIGLGFGKANEVSEAIRKATEAANKRMITIPLSETTIPHEVFGSFGGGKVMLRPASHGTGVVAGGSMRAVMEAVGIRDILAKSLGSGNPANVVKATVDALSQLRPRDEIYKLRGKALPKASLPTEPIVEPAIETDAVVPEESNITDEAVSE